MIRSVNTYRQRSIKPHFFAQGLAFIKTSHVSFVRLTSSVYLDFFSPVGSITGLFYIIHSLISRGAMFGGFGSNDFLAKKFFEDVKKIEGKRRERELVINASSAWIMNNNERQKNKEFALYSKHPANEINLQDCQKKISI